MAKIHILYQSRKKDSVKVVYHVTIPNTTNQASVNYRTALVEFLDPDGTGIESEIVDLATKDSEEWDSLQAGSVYEETHEVKFDANLTPAQKAAIVDSHYQSRETGIISTMQDVLEYWGMTRNPT